MGDKDPRKDLGDQLEGLFSDVIPEPKPEVEEKKDEFLLEETVITSLLEGETVVAPAAAEPMAVEVSPPVSMEPEEVRKEHEISPVSAPPWEATLRTRRTRVLNILLDGVIILGGVLLICLLIRLIWQTPKVWSGFHTPYWAACTVAAVVTLIQWLLNSSLTRSLREAEDKHTEAVRSQTLLADRVEELATANALLQRRALQFQAAAQVSHAVTSVLDPDELVQEAVNRIRDQFGLYYVGLFLIDESGEWAVLRAGTGEAGRQMLAQGYRLEMNGNSTTDRCIANAQARIALDIASAQARLHSAEASAEPGEEAVYLDDVIEIVEVNPLLPETRSEIALPLLSSGRVIGALDIHSTEREAFSEEDIPVLQTMADQVAVALDNVRLFAKAQATLEVARCVPAAS